MKPNKIKFLNFQVSYSHKELLEDFKVVENPTHFKSVPDGEYLIRGDKKAHAKEYWVKDNVWYLSWETTYDNGHYYYYAAKYQLFPFLSEKEWEIINKAYNYLTPYWKRAVYGRNCFMEKKEYQRNFLKERLKFGSKRTFFSKKKKRKRKCNNLPQSYPKK